MISNTGKVFKNKQFSPVRAAQTYQKIIESKIKLQDSPTGANSQRVSKFSNYSASNRTLLQSYDATVQRGNAMILERDYANQLTGLKQQDSVNSSLYNPKYMVQGAESEGLINLHASSKEIIRQTERPVDLKYCSVLRNKNERDR